MFSLEHLTATERHLVAYLEAHLGQVPSLSITKLSQKANVSTASIVRTMKKLGYDGFTAFKHAIKQQLRGDQASSITYQILDDNDQKIQEVILKNDLEVRQTLALLDKRQIEDAIQAIAGAGQVYLFARGLSELIASEMEVKFHLLGRTCELYTDPNIIRTISKRLTDQDLVLLISLNGQTQELVAAAQPCVAQEVPLVLLTANGGSSLAQLADISLVGYKSEISYFPDYEVRSRLPLQVIGRILLDAYAIRVGGPAS